MKKLLYGALALLAGAFFISSCASNKVPSESKSASEAVKAVYSYGFVDLEGAKVSAIILEYDQPVFQKSLTTESFEIENFTLNTIAQSGRDTAIELDYDGIEGNEGQITKVYVNDKPQTSTKSLKSGKYVIIEVNTDYMLSSANLVYSMSMIAGAKQVKDIVGSHNLITASDSKFVNYEQTTKETPRGTRTQLTADKDKIILPEFGEESGWTLNYIGDGAFKATHCYSEYTGLYYDFELPYSIYLPDQKTMEANKGKIALTIHMEHAGSNDTDPMAAITSSRAAVMHASPLVQKNNPAIIVVPQIEEERRSTNDLVASSEANTAVWELIDYLLEKYRDYIDTNRIYGTGQSMGGMTILNMASQRDNFFAGIAVVGAQWSNSYDKPFQNNGSPARSPENDPISFNGFGLDAENYQNWYYMISDDNILVHTCADDPMAKGEWGDTAEYFAAAGVTIPYAEINPYLSLEEQLAIDSKLLDHQTKEAGSGITWGGFTLGNHMSTWKYGYRLTTPFIWLYKQTRESEMERAKLEQLKNPWIGRNADGTIKEGSGTSGLNSAQYTPGGASEIFTEGWTRESVKK
ncbi:MAG: prolyl oligopeptidase family serine peptidase [Treponema sp.]|nr:prolyl oligopeptidase family serine peptidase [Treponema sp.]